MEKEAQLIFLPFYHNYGFHLIMFGLITGSTSIVMRRFQLRNYFAAIEKYKVTGNFFVFTASVSKRSIQTILDSLACTCPATIGSFGQITARRRIQSELG
jgi:hypothetical protein